MSMYDSRQPYPSWYDDEIGISMCENCYFDCWTHEYCIKEEK